MRLLIWLSDRRTAVVAWYGNRRMFRRHKLTPAAQARLREAARRRTP